MAIKKIMFFIILTMTIFVLIFALAANNDRSRSIIDTFVFRDAKIKNHSVTDYVLSFSEDCDSVKSFGKAIVENFSQLGSFIRSMFWKRVDKFCENRCVDIRTETSDSNKKTVVEDPH